MGVLFVYKGYGISARLGSRNIHCLYLTEYLPSIMSYMFWVSGRHSYIFSRHPRSPTPYV